VGSKRATRFLFELERSSVFEGAGADRAGALESRMKKGEAGNRFQSDAAKYGAYLGTPEGRLRLDLAFANLQDFLPADKASLRALDIGCGTGATAVRLARLGVPVTLIDSSPEMLKLAERSAKDGGVVEKIALKHGDATRLSSLFQGRSFDLVLCHNVLEYIDDPVLVLGSAARLLRDSSSIISVLLRNRAGEVLKAAIQAGDLAAAEQAWTSKWGTESLYGGKVRLFTVDEAREMLRAVSLTVVEQRGVRVVADYLPPRLSRGEEYARILALERNLGSLAEFASVARYAQFLARLSPPMKDRA
jgi:S-adenosylmethionine-dependent methyltransferase